MTVMGGLASSALGLGAGGQKGNLASYFPKLSGDGRLVAFESSSSNLTPDNPNGDYGIYVRDLDTGAVAFVAGNNPALSGDGRYVAFEAGNVYVRDLETGPRRSQAERTGRMGPGEPGIRVHGPEHLGGRNEGRVPDGRRPGSRRQRRDAGHLPARPIHRHHDSDQPSDRRGRGGRTTGPKPGHLERRQVRRLRVGGLQPRSGRHGGSEGHLRARPPNRHDHARQPWSPAERAHPVPKHLDGWALRASTK